VTKTHSECVVVGDTPYETPKTHSECVLVSGSVERRAGR
jgi:hypothetical protein